MDYLGNLLCAQLVDFVDKIDGVLRQRDTVAERDDEELIENHYYYRLVWYSETLVAEDLLPDGEVFIRCFVFSCKMSIRSS